MRTLTAALAAAMLLASGAQASPVASAAKACSVPKYPSSGYFTSLNVKHVSCATGRKLALAYYRCKEKRNSIATEIDARVTCRRGSRTITHTYQQNI